MDIFRPLIRWGKIGLLILLGLLVLDVALSLTLLYVFGTDFLWCLLGMAAVGYLLLSFWVPRFQGAARLCWQAVAALWMVPTVLSKVLALILALTPWRKIFGFQLEPAGAGVHAESPLAQRTEPAVYEGEFQRVDER